MNIDEERYNWYKKRLGHAAAICWSATDPIEESVHWTKHRKMLEKAYSAIRASNRVTIGHSNMAGEYIVTILDIDEEGDTLVFDLYPFHKWARVTHARCNDKIYRFSCSTAVADIHWVVFKIIRAIYDRIKTGQKFYETKDYLLNRFIYDAEP